MNQTRFSMKAIGVVRSPVSEGKDDGWGDVVAELHIDPAFARGLDGLEGYSHALVLFWMHEATFEPARDLVRRPRGRADMPELGIFAQRAKHRPNPLAVTAVRIIERKPDAAVLVVRGLDAIDGSPVLDLKPYVSAFDRVEAPVEPAWIGRLMEGYF
jgi:tRNA-Thr(GGU) m(6)t(6)A37 methyltransferase TsaA